MFHKQIYYTKLAGGSRTVDSCLPAVTCPAFLLFFIESLQDTFEPFPSQVLAKATFNREDLGHNAELYWRVHWLEICKEIWMQKG